MSNPVNPVNPVQFRTSPRGAHSGHSRWAAIIGLVLAAALLYLALRGMDWGAALATLRRARPPWLALAALIASLAYALRAVRWWVLLGAEVRVGLLTVFWAQMLGYLGNAFLPARAGELVRSAALARRLGGEGYKGALVLATALTERILDAVALVLAGTVAAACTAEMPEPLRAGGRWLALAGVGALAALTFVPRLEPWLQRGLAVLPLPEHWRCRLRGTVEQFLLGMRAFQRPPRALGFGGLTVAIWLTDALGAAVIARALGLSLGLLQALLLLAALGLASALPSMPGYVGVYPVVAVALLPTCGFSRSEALAYVLVMQALNYAVVSVYGLWGMWQLR